VGEIFFRAKNFFVDDDSRLSAIGLKAFRHFSLRWRSKTSASGMTMTPLVYLMMMPEYCNVLVAMQADGLILLLRT
jgi:hypothetical protein